MYQQGIVSYRDSDPEIGPQVYLGPIKIGKLKCIGFGEYQIFGDVTLGKDEICVKMTGLNFQVS